MGLAELLALANAVRIAVFDRRALDGRDFTPPTGPASEGSMVEDIVERTMVLEQELAACEQALADALRPGAPQPGRELTAALERASALVSVSPWAISLATDRELDAELLAELVDEARAVASTVSRLQKQWREAPAAAAGDPSEKLELAKKRIRLVFGQGFPVLAPFVMDAPLLAEWQASLADQDALYRRRSKLATVQWLRSASLVRPGARALSAALDAAAWSGNAAAGLAGGLVVQLPHLAGRAWASLPFSGEPPQDVRLSAVLFGHLPEEPVPLVGVLVEEWSEAIPEAKTTTSVAFQYDAPGARAPQTICPAVDAGVDAGGWTADALVDTVSELFDLSKLRLIKPSQVRGAGAMLPTVFIPQNLSKEQPSMDMLGLLAKRPMLAEGLLGKD